MKSAASEKSAKKVVSRQSNPDAIDLLTDDHKKVKKLFKEFEQMKEGDAGGSEKAELVKQICEELTVHAQIEEEIFYPAVHDAIADDDLMDEAEVEHTSAKELIAQLQEMSPSEDLYDAKVTVLGEYIDHHVKEEQEEMFPKVKKAKVDTKEIGARLMERKQELAPAAAEKSGREKTSH